MKMESQKHAPETSNQHQPNGGDWNSEVNVPAVSTKLDAPNVASMSMQEPKKRKVHMSDKECLDHSRTAGGAMALTNPEEVKRSSKDPNRGLYPRPSKSNSHHSRSFVSAREMMEVGADNLLTAFHSDALPSLAAPAGQVAFLSSTKPGLPAKGKKNRNYMPQQNKVSNYFCRASSPSPKDPGDAHSISSTPPRPSHSPSQKTSKMYSPLKKVSGADSIFEVDLTASPESSKRLLQSSSVDAVKVLFDSQRAVCFGQPQKVRKGKKREPRFNRDNKFLYSSDPMPGNLMAASGTGDDPYGLLGSGIGVACSSSDEEEEPVDYFAQLPMEVVENIFCYLSLMDLLLNVSRVCKDWNAVVSNERFAPWKKKYHRLRIKHSATITEIVQAMKDNGMATADRYLPGLIEYMANFKPVTASNMLECLQQHPRYLWAEDLLKERFPQCIRYGTPNPWSMMTTLVILSEFVKDIVGIIECLLRPRSRCTAMEVSECLYCMATFLCSFKSTRYQDVWTGMHYRVFYGLYLFENSSCKAASELTNAFKAPGQQTILKYSTSDDLQLTHEQFRICNHDIQADQTIKIVAFAGTGKTTTLLRYTQLRPQLRFLLVVYNKCVCEHAKKLFPGNVTCKTGHGLAFGHTGRRYRGKLGNLKVGTLVAYLPHRKGQSLYVQAKFVQDAINNYASSADQCITTAHVPRERKSDEGTLVGVSHEQQMELANDAERIWQLMQDPQMKKMPMTHDGYLKLYQLQKPKIDDYDVILIDEAQDLTPAIADILLRQTEPKILVGDPHQQIYAFRGAVNAMESIQATHTFYLTQSFRFGPEIAFVAASCLEFLKGEKRKVLVGSGVHGSIRGDTEGQVAIICRTNFTVFQEAAKKCNADDCVRVAFAGGVGAFGFDMIMDIYELMKPAEERDEGQIKNGLVNGFIRQGFAELERYATKTADHELLGKIKIVKTYNIQLPTLIPKIRSMSTDHLEMADYVFSTAHKAKGLEFSTVQLTDDFNVIPRQAVEMGLGFCSVQTSEQESNLLYVAVTRAKRRLILTQTVVSMLKSCGEDFLYPVHSPQLKKEGMICTCLKTGQTFEPLAVTLVKRPVITGPDLTRSELGVLRPQVVREDCIGFRHILGSLVDEREEQRQRQQQQDLQNEQQLIQQQQILLAQQEHHA